jgi:hypothetical protein
MRTILILLTITIFTFSCQQKSEFQKMKDQELASGIRNDSLFFGIYLGMPNQDFFDLCLKMNQKKLFTHGTTSTSVEYVFTGDKLKYPTKMNFYPKFGTDGKIVEMATEFEYVTWSPWLKDRYAEFLQEEVLNLFNEWYGEGFLKIPHPQFEFGYTKVDGNRLIVIERKSDRIVKVNYRDLFADGTSS